MSWLLLMACGNIEGDAPGECTDGADNDANGVFDCRDPGCAEDEACVEPTDSEPFIGDSEDSAPPIETGETGETAHTGHTGHTGETDPPIDTGPFDSDGDGSWDMDDCDPDEARVHPGAAWRETDLCTIDLDGDGFGGTPPIGDAGTDCDDNDATRHPRAMEWLGDGIDQDCDGTLDEDAEADDAVAHRGTDWAGRAVHLVPDTDADGFAEIAVGGPVGEMAWMLRSGWTDDTDLSLADLEVEGEASGDYTGAYLSHGDLDGDGVQDLIVAGSQNDSNRGAAYIFSGSRTGSFGAADASSVLRGTTDSMQLAVGVLGMDADGDGSDDLVASTYGYGVWVYDGPISSGETVAWKVASDENDLYRSECSRIDWDGDGVEELLVGGYGSNGAGSMYLVSNASGANLTMPGDAEQVLTGSHFNSYLGERNANVGDVDGDGLDDLLAGGSGYSSYAGMATLYLGGSGSAAWTLYGDAAQQIGRSVGGADLDGDGDSDLAVGSYVVDDYRGAIYVFLDGSGTVDVHDADRVLVGSNKNDYVGWDLAGGQDVTGDGKPDLVIGAALYEGSGAALVMEGL